MRDKICSVCGRPIEYIGNAADYQYKSMIHNKQHYFCGYNCQVMSEEIRANIEIEDSVITKARETYGNKNQIAVCIEELSELTKVLAKYFRYDEEMALTKLRDDALDEVADVYIILEHVKGIFRLRNGEINKRAKAKLSRMERWLSTSKDFSYTMEDRRV